MGYHNNEATTKKCIKDAQLFINDRARLEHALRLTLNSIGISQSTQSEMIERAKLCDFTRLEEYLKTIDSPVDLNRYD